MRVVLVEPGKPAREAQVDNDLDSFQSLVQGMLTVVCPFDDPVVLVANDNAVAEGHEPNRTVNGCIIPGPFFICGEDDEGDFCSLSPELARKYTGQFRNPETFPTKRLRIEVRMICPLCGRAFSERPAVSRTDNNLLICPRCGTREALDAAGIPIVIAHNILLDLG